MEPSDAESGQSPVTGSQAEAVQYLSSLINRDIHVHIADGRMFVGQMKCTDNECNVILSMSHEYRQPSQQDIQLAARRHEAAGLSGNVRVDLKKRFVGLVVIPGQHITKMELGG